MAVKGLENFGLLKIKDDVDLKELEKLGFEKSEDGDYKRVFDKDTYREEVIYISTNKKYIQVCAFYTLFILYDLIKAGLVEKELFEK